MMLSEPAEDVTPLMSPNLSQSPATKRLRVRILLLTCAVAGLFMFSISVTGPPRTQIIEDIICNRYYGHQKQHPTNSERDCKQVEIQSEMAMIQGWADALGQLPGTINSRYRDGLKI